MVTAKKPAAKKAPAKKVLVQSNKVATAKKEEEFRMPTEVKDWIDQAHSRINHLTHEVARLKEENLKLRRANKVMEARVLGSSFE